MPASASFSLPSTASSQSKKLPVISRREFLLGSLASGLLVACGGKTPVMSKVDTNQAEHIDQQTSWLHIGNDDKLTIVIPSCEMGQGVNTSLATLVCDELDADWQSVRVVTAPVDPTFSNPKMRMQLTGGSTSIPAFWLPMRQIGAAARQMLLETAALRLDVSPDTLSCQNGVITTADGRSVRYGELAEQAMAQPVPDLDAVTLKTPEQFTLIGKSVSRIEGPEKVNGNAQFGIDVQVPDMRIATISQSPVFGGKLVRYNKAAALAVNGVEQVVALDGAVAVVASGYWPAQKGLKALAAEFEGGIEPELSSSEVSARLRAALDEKKPRPLTNTAKVLELEYEVPYLAHATLEPMTCTAHVTEERCEIWVPSQSQSQTHSIAKKLTKLDDKQIVVHTTLLGGGFGRRGENDFVGQAVQISQAVGKPVKLIWSREEDTQHDFYRPATVGRLQIGLDENGTPNHWQVQIAGSSIFKRLFRNVAPSALSWIPMTSVIGDPVAAEGAKEVPYLPSQYGESEFSHEIVDAAIPVGFWRSVGHSHNAFFIESAIDEAAQLADEDAYQYRRRLLAKHPRWLQVLDKAAQMADWGNTPQGRVQGIAVHESFGSFVAQVVELSIVGDKQVKLHKIWCAADCGAVVNPDTVKAQMEGGLIFGLVAAAVGEVTVEQGRILQSNFHDYPLLRMIDVPDIEVELITSSEAPGGAGEPGTPPIAPALTNALFAATGERLRQLPISKSGYVLAPVRI